jgi:hypothetical protein
MKKATGVAILFLAALFLALPSGTWASENGLVKLGKAIDSLTLNADLRIRYELRDRDEVAPDKKNTTTDRMRTRFRLGFVWDNNEESWKVGAGLCTGGADATSTNATWSNGNFFETGDIRLDYAFAQHKLGDSVKFTAGQQKMLWNTSWLLWDGDVRPAGFTFNFDRSGFFATAGAYVARQYGNNMGKLYVAQLGYAGKIDSFDFMLSTSYQPFNKELDEQNRPNSNYKWEIYDVYGTAGIPIGDVKLSAYGHWFVNLGADGDVGQGVLGGTLKPGDEDTGWVAGLDAKYKAFGAGVAYAEVGADSCFGPLKDGDFGSGISDTDLRGWVASLSYNITKNFSVAGKGLFYEAKTRDKQPSVNLYQVDLGYKF